MYRAASVVAVCLLLAAAPASAGSCDRPVYLTFDVGNMSAARDVAAVLAHEHIRAAFFLADNPTAEGNRALDPAWGDFWRARVAEGHVFGNHTWSHFYARADEGSRVRVVDRDGNTRQLDQAAFCEELARVDRAFHGLTGRHLDGMWRAPAGRTTQQSIRWAGECGYPVHVGWTAHGYVGDDLPSDRHPNAELLRKTLEQARPGEVLLMHLGVWSRKDPWPPQLPALIAGLRERGFCFAQLTGPAR